MKASGDSFGPFLRTLHRSDEGGGSAEINAGGPFQLQVLGVLAQRGPLPATELLRESKASVIELARTLDAMREIGLIRVEREPDGDEFVRLTDSGARLMHVAS